MANLLCCHYGAQMIEIRISPGNILQVELGEGVVGLPTASEEDLL